MIFMKVATMDKDGWSRGKFGSGKLSALLLVVAAHFCCGCFAAADFRIPVVDLTGETNRQVIVDRERGQYLGNVTTVLLEDN